jgi:hypothetical protein
VVRVRIQTGVASDGQFADEETGKHREEISNVEGHDRQHAANSQYFDSILDMMITTKLTASIQHQPEQ